MWDLFIVALTMLFFAVAIGYVYGCERLHRAPGGRGAAPQTEAHS